MSPRKRLRPHSPPLPRPRCYRSSGCRRRASIFYSTAAHLRSRSRLTAAPPMPRAFSHPPAGDPADAAALLATPRRFQYPATRLQYDLGLERASTIALDQLACTSLFAAVRLPRAARGGGGATAGAS